MTYFFAIVLVICFAGMGIYLAVQKARRLISLRRDRGYGGEDD